MLVATGAPLEYAATQVCIFAQVIGGLLRSFVLHAVASWQCQQEKCTDLIAVVDIVALAVRIGLVGAHHSDAAALLAHINRDLSDHRRAMRSLFMS